MDKKKQIVYACVIGFCLVAALAAYFLQGGSSPTTTPTVEQAVIQKADAMQKSMEQQPAPKTTPAAPVAEIERKVPRGPTPTK